MIELNTIIAQLLLIFIASALLTGAYRHYAKQKAILDIPESRSAHFRLITRGGGIAIVLVFLITIILIPPKSDLYWSLLIGGCWIALIGFIDDLSHIPPQWRILLQSLAVLLPVLLIHGGAMPFPTWLAYPLTFIGLLWLLNLFNFMDGIDAIAGIELVTTACCAAFLLYIQNAPAMICYLLFLVFAVLGFLAWNMPPARIFMGDVGSSFLGFILGVLALYTIVHGHLKLYTWLILLACFIGDTTFTLLHRMMRGDQWYQGHCLHTYQKAAFLLAKKSRNQRQSRQRAFAHRTVISILAIINICWLLPFAFLVETYPHYWFLYCALAYAPIILLAVIFQAGQPMKTEPLAMASETK